MGDVAGRGGARIAESLATSVLLRVPALTDALVQTIHEQNPGYRAVNVVPKDDLWWSCHDNLSRVLQLLAGLDREPADGKAGDGKAGDFYDAARATGRRRAEQRLPLDDVLRSFRLGGRLVWQALIDQARAESAADTDALLDVGTRVWEVVDATSAQVANAYHAAERELLRADEQRRAALWEGLLRGRATDLAYAYEVSRIVGLPVDGPYAVVVTGDRAEPGLTLLLGRRLVRHGVESVWQRSTDTLVGLLALRRPALEGVLATLREVLDGPAGVSLVVSGLAEVDQAYRQAILARRTLPAGTTKIVALAERFPEAILLSTPELSEPLVRLWLGPLLDLPGGDRQVLLDTLRAWVAAAGSTTRTAEALHCHRNTVINRMRRVEAVTGRDFADGTIPIELALALRAVSQQR